MSIVVVNEVLDSSRSRGSARVLMIVLAEQAGEDSRCWPGIPRLARRVNVTERNIKILTRELEEMGELLVDFGSGRGNTNLYRVLPEATSTRLIQDLTEQLERVKSSAERVKISALLERVKLSAQRVKLFDERVKASTKRVKQVSPEPPRTLEPQTEPTATAGEGTSQAAAAAGQTVSETAPQAQGSAAHAGTPDGAQEANAQTGSGQVLAQASAGTGQATSTEKVPGAAGGATLAVLVGALAGLKTSVPDLIAEFDYRADWMTLSVDEARQLVADVRRRKGPRYRGDLISALDELVLSRRAPLQSEEADEDIDMGALIDAAPTNGIRRKS